MLSSFVNLRVMRCKIFTVAGLVAAWWLEAASCSQMCTLSPGVVLVTASHQLVCRGAELLSARPAPADSRTRHSLTGRRLTPGCRPIRGRHSPPPLTLEAGLATPGSCSVSPVSPLSVVITPPPAPALTRPALSKYLAKMEKCMDSLKAGRADWHTVRPVKTK